MSIGAWRLLWTLADKSLTSGSISSFQSVSLGKLTCCLSARIRIRRGQTDGKTLAVDLEGQTALFIIVGLPAQIGMLCCILCQPLFERGIVCLDFNGFAGFVKIDAGRFSAVWSVRFSCCLHFCLFCKNRRIFKILCQLYTCKNRLIFAWGAPK